MFNITRGPIEDIERGRTWKHVPTDVEEEAAAIDGVVL
jgi:hypothetical protein